MYLALSDKHRTVSIALVASALIGGYFPLHRRFPGLYNIFSILRNHGSMTNDKLIKQKQIREFNPEVRGDIDYSTLVLT